MHSRLVMTMTPKPSWRELAKRAFRDRHIFYRRGREFHFVVVSKRAQLALAAVPAVAGLIALMLGLGIAQQQREAELRERRVSELLDSYNNLALDYRHSQVRFLSAAGELEAKYRRLREAANQQGGLKRELSTIDDTLQRLAAERDNLTQYRERLVDRVAAVHDRASGDSSARDFQERTKQIEAQWELLDRARERTLARIEMLEDGLRMTGLDLEILAKAVDGQPGAVPGSGLGGPYIAISDIGKELDEIGGGGTANFDDELQALDSELAYLGRLQIIATRVPLARPVRNAWLASRFGRRRDPITERPAFHAGLDFSGLPMTPIMATAAGVVTFAGRGGPYGNMIEIDHGHGFKTRYGHLRKILVQGRATVAAGQIIGSMGSTGRSTGTHLHYEIRFNGRNLNPSKFIEAGDHVHKQQTASDDTRGGTGDHPSRE
jgi:murein DD-endopeptidase MepM/ murein hydrolase activator NlpD